MPCSRGDITAQRLEWALGSLGLGAWWEEKPVFQEKRIFSGTRDDGGQASGKENFLEGSLLLQGWKGGMQGKKWDEGEGRGRGISGWGKEPLFCGVFGLDEAGISAEAMGQRPRDQSMRVLGPSQSVLHLRGATTHPFKPPGDPLPPPPPAQAAPAPLRHLFRVSWPIPTALPPAALRCPSSPFFLFSLLKQATVFLVQRSVHTF